jgi:hypothetical protein
VTRSQDTKEEDFFQYDYAEVYYDEQDPHHENPKGYIAINQTVATCPGVSYEYSIQYQLVCMKPNDCYDTFFGLSINDAISGATIAAKSFTTDPGCNCTDPFGNAFGTWNNFSLGLITASSKSTNVGWAIFENKRNDTGTKIEETVLVRNAVFQMV